MDKKTQKIEKLKAQQEKIKARIQLLEASEKSKERKLETRRKICLGAYYLDKARSEGNYDEVVKIMGGYLKRDSDRALFDLDLLKNDKTKAVTPE